MGPTVTAKSIFGLAQAYIYIAQQDERCSAYAVSLFFFLSFFLSFLLSFFLPFFLSFLFLPLPSLFSFFLSLPFLFFFFFLWGRVDCVCAKKYKRRS